MPQLCGKEVGPIGYGLMGLTWRKNPPPQSQSFTAMRASLTHGANAWNGGEIYGNASRNSLHLLSEYFDQYPDDASKIVLSIKGGCLPDKLQPDGSPANIRRSIDECLRILDGKKSLDLFECARVDPNTPIETTIKAISEYVEAGKLGGISLSEVRAETIRRAAKVYKIEAVEVEFSMWATDILENGIAQACADVGATVIAYSPLGRGFLTGEIRTPDDVPEGDLRRGMPRFQPENFEKNIKLVHQVEDLAKQKGVKAGQVALGWVLAKSGKNGLPTIIPIPGATTGERVAENCMPAELSEEDVKAIDGFLSAFEVKGDRYGSHSKALMNG